MTVGGTVCHWIAVSSCFINRLEAANLFLIDIILWNIYHNLKFHNTKGRFEDRRRGWGTKYASWKISVYLWSIFVSLFIPLISFLYLFLFSPNIYSPFLWFFSSSCIIVLKIITIFHDSFVCFIQIVYLSCSYFLPLFQCGFASILYQWGKPQYKKKRKSSDNVTRGVPPKVVQSLYFCSNK